jgi:UDP-N-acetylglucosamine 2-epimerase (non-hydrolysing)
MKIAPLVRELRRIPAAHHLLVHTGQHYDDQLSAVFFRDLGLPEPDINLQVGSGSHAWQTAEIMQRLEPVLRDWIPDLVIVVGDVNSTLAAALTAAKLGLRIAHVEAGLRSFDPRMPEEINRKLTDAIANFLFVTEESGIRNLRNEGISSERIFLVGNVMIDSLLHHRNLAARSNILEQLSLATDGSDPHPYAVLTLHRPSNVDDAKVLQNILETVATLAQDLPVYFPIHPRTKGRINTLGYDHYFASDHNKPAPRGLLPLDPLGYLDFLCLMDHARLVLTDSGGIQEETTVLGTPCLTLRETTERPVTIEQGTNRLVGLNPRNILDVARHVLTANNLKGGRPPLWDGHAAKRIVKIILERLRTEQSNLCSQSETSFSSASS